MGARGKQVIPGRMCSHCGPIFSLFPFPLRISLSLIITTEGCLQTWPRRNLPLVQNGCTCQASFSSFLFLSFFLFFFFFFQTFLALRLVLAVTGTKLRNFYIFMGVDEARVHPLRIRVSLLCENGGEREREREGRASYIHHKDHKTNKRDLTLSRNTRRNK